MIRIVAVGKLKNKHLAALAADYLQRIGGMASCTVVEIKDTDPRREGDDMIRRLGSATGNEVVVALDERGERADSLQLAKLLATHGQISFLIGGADGLGSDARQRADRTLRLSSMTWTHEMARVLLIEQVYRGFSIIKGRPYHRG